MKRESMGWGTADDAISTCGVCQPICQRKKANGLLHALPCTVLGKDSGDVNDERRISQLQNTGWSGNVGGFSCHCGGHPVCDLASVRGNAVHRQCDRAGASQRAALWQVVQCSVQSEQEGAYGH